MSKTILASLKPSLLSDDLNQENETWVEMARTGKWDGYQGGESFELSSDAFDEMIRNFDAQKNPRPVYEGHADLYGEAPAVGWIRELKREGESLMGRVEFLSDFADLVRKGAYKFASIYAELTGAIDRVTGEDIGAYLRSLAITNQPFIDALEPIQLSEASVFLSEKEARTYLRAGEKTNMSKEKTEETSEVELEETSEETEEVSLDDEKDALMAALQEIAGDPELTVESALAMLQERKEALMEAMKAGDEEEQEAPVPDAELSETTSASEVDDLKEENETLKAQLSAYQEKELDELLSKKALAEDKKAELKELGLTDRATFNKFYGVLPSKEETPSVHLTAVSTTKLEDTVSSFDGSTMTDYEKKLRNRLNLKKKGN